MRRTNDTEAMDLSGRDWQAWLSGVDTAFKEIGTVQPLGADHAALFRCTRTPVLLVTFERFDGLSDQGHPLGWTLIDALGWSHLCLLGKGDAWFRDPLVQDHLDRLKTDGFFDDFEQVVFYGAGSCAHAASAFSVAVPGARVLMLSPQSPPPTPEPNHASGTPQKSFWERDAQACEISGVVIDNLAFGQGAEHPALRDGSTMLRFPMRLFGLPLEDGLVRMKVLVPFLIQLRDDRPSRRSLAQLWRKRRDDRGYLLALMRHLVSERRDLLVVMLCRNVLARRRGGPRFRKALNAAQARLASRHKAL